MSRIGKAPVAIPSGVTVAVEGNVFKVKGPKGELEQQFDAVIGAVEENKVVFTAPRTCLTIAPSTVCTVSFVLAWWRV